MLGVSVSAQTPSIDESRLETCVSACACIQACAWTCSPEQLARAHLAGTLDESTRVPCQQDQTRLHRTCWSSKTRWCCACARSISCRMPDLLRLKPSTPTRHFQFSNCVLTSHCCSPIFRCPGPWTA